MITEAGLRVFTYRPGVVTGVGKVCVCACVCIGAERERMTEREEFSVCEAVHSSVYHTNSKEWCTCAWCVRLPDLWKRPDVFLIIMAEMFHLVSFSY